MADAHSPFATSAAALAALPPAPDLRGAAARLLKGGLEHARADLARQTATHPGRGHAYARQHAATVDALIRLLADFVTDRLHPHGLPTTGERLAIIATGGYGRGELAPHSDIDLLFLTPGRRTPWTEQVIESLLYALWDLGPKVGHAVRSLDETVRSARSDLTVRTAMLETRLIWGDPRLYTEGGERFRREVVHGTAATFVADKLAERTERHRRFKDSRYVVEPNLKDGKGGLRDLQTLFWIGRYLHPGAGPDALVRHGLLSAAELRQAQRAADFFWAVRWQLHSLAGRAEERLTFDVQPELARRLRYADRPGAPGVERFMRHYFLHAKTVGALTGTFLAQLEEEFGHRGWLPVITRRPKALGGFALRRGRVAAPTDVFFREDPRCLLTLFETADANALEVDPGTLRQAARDSARIDDRVRADPKANAAFMSVLTSPRDPETLLRHMNECGVFGRFVPDFGRVVAKMQFDMYHHFTVDEHTIRAIGLLSRIERGALSADYPLASRIAHQVTQRRALYVAMLLHDIAKGRRGDHSIIGAEIAGRLCPRLGLDAAETETVAWLVRWHLLMSATAFKRDLTDPETIATFAAAVGSLERLKMLLVLTTVDISAVGPGLWTKWKAQLIGELYEAAEARLRLGYLSHGREGLVAERIGLLRAAMGWSAEETTRYAARFPDSYFIAEQPDVLEANARLVMACDAGLGCPARATADPTTGVTQVSVYASDRPGLFADLAGAIALAGASVADARIHTTIDGRALDNFAVQDPLGGLFDEPRRLKRLEQLLSDAVAGRLDGAASALANRPLPRRRAEAFAAAPQIHVSNRASSRFTVVEVGALDRPGLLHDLTRALAAFGASIRSAHIATYGARANDTFYVVDARGRKISDQSEVDALERALTRAAGGMQAAVA